MASAKRRKLDSTVAALQQRFGAQSIRTGSALSAPTLPSAIATGFAQLDAITGCRGIPLGAITLLSGRTTSGKATVAFKTLASAQGASASAVRHNVALVDLNHTVDPEYLARCGVDLAHLLIVRPSPGAAVVQLLLDLIRQRQVRAMVVSSLSDLTYPRSTYMALNAALPRLAQAVRTAGVALVFLDEASPPWLRWLNWDRSWAVRRWAALHVELQREAWLAQDERFVGYSAQARMLKSRWRSAATETMIEIIFNGTVKAGAGW